MDINLILEPFTNMKDCLYIEQLTLLLKIKIVKIITHKEHLNLNDSH